MTHKSEDYKISALKYYLKEYFNQVKTYLKKNRNVENYQQLEKM